MNSIFMFKKKLERFLNYQSSTSKTDQFPAFQFCRSVNIEICKEGLSYASCTVVLLVQVVGFSAANISFRCPAPFTLKSGQPLLSLTLIIKLP